MIIIKKEVIAVKKGQKAIVRVVALRNFSSVGDGAVKPQIINIYESHDFIDSFYYKDGKTLKAAIANRIADGLEDLDATIVDKLEVYLIKSADPAEEK